MHKAVVVTSRDHICSVCSSPGSSPRSWPRLTHIPAGKRQDQQPPCPSWTIWGCSEPIWGCSGEPQLGTAISAPPLQLLGCFGAQQRAAQLRKDTGLCLDLRTQNGGTKDTLAAAQQALPETFWTEINHSALTDCPRGFCREGWQRGEAQDPLLCSARVYCLSDEHVYHPDTVSPPLIKCVFNYTSGSSPGLCHRTWPRPEPGSAPVQPLPQSSTQPARNGLGLL